MFHHDVLVPFGSGSGSDACFPSSLFILFSGMAFCSTMISWFLVVPALVPVLVSLLLSSFFSQEMVFCFLVPAQVPVLVSLLLSFFFSQEKGSVPMFHHDLLVAPGSGSGSGGCLPSYLFFLFSGNWVVFHHDFLVPSGSGSSACLPSSLFFLFSGNGVLFPGSGSGSGACLPSSLFLNFSGKGFCSIMICWLLLVPARVRVVVSFLSLLSFFRKLGCVPS